jgi:hypothetical protein
MFGVLFYLLLVFFVLVITIWTFLCSRRFKTIRKKTLSNNKQEARQVTLDYIDPMCFLSLVHILAFMLLYCYLSLILLGFGFHTWLVMLSPAVLSVIQVFHPLWCWFWLVSLWDCCGLPSMEMWFDRVRIDAVVWAQAGMVEMVNTVMACGCLNLQRIES